MAAVHVAKLVCRGLIGSFMGMKRLCNWRCSGGSRGVPSHPDDGETSSWELAGSPICNLGSYLAMY